jgi:hypothetical protein
MSFILALCQRSQALHTRQLISCPAAKNVPAANISIPSPTPSGDRTENQLYPQLLHTLAAPSLLVASIFMNLPASLSCLGCPIGGSLPVVICVILELNAKVSRCCSTRCFLTVWLEAHASLVTGHRATYLGRRHVGARECHGAYKW